jgi:hypothetical protein
MGTWGPGNFQNDAALDFVGRVLRSVTTKVEAFHASDRVDIDDLDVVLAGLAIHLALHENCNAIVPSLEFVLSLRDKILRIYDEQIDSLSPQGDHKAERRAAIEDTLRRYETAARQAA